MNDSLAVFVSTSALRWQRDRNYRDRLMREAKPVEGERIKRARRKR